MTANQRDLLRLIRRMKGIFVIGADLRVARDLEAQGSVTVVTQRTSDDGCLYWATLNTGP